MVFLRILGIKLFCTNLSKFPIFQTSITTLWRKLNTRSGKKLIRGPRNKNLEQNLLIQRREFKKQQLRMWAKTILTWNCNRREKIIQDTKANFVAKIRDLVRKATTIFKKNQKLCKNLGLDQIHIARAKYLKKK
jgi:hypothetical protein